MFGFSKTGSSRLTIRRLALGSTAAIFALGLLGAVPAPALAKEVKDVVIGLSMKTRAQRRWALDEAQMQAEADRLGVKLIFQWANDSPTDQASQFENLLSQNVDAIIMVPVDAAAAAKLVDEAHQQNVPVISYDVDIPGAKLDFKVTRDNYQVGVVQANAALKFSPKGTYALIKGDPANNVAHSIADAYAKVLGTNKDIKIVYDQYTTNWDPKTAQSVAENVLSAQSDKVDAFVVSNDGMATGVAQAVRGRNLEGKVFISGLDAEAASLQLIADGAQTMTVWSDLATQDKAAIDAAVALALGQKPDMPTVMVDDGAGPYPAYQVAVSEVNKDNLCEFVTKLAPKGWAEISEVWPDNPDACK
ncbi:substrate-binding domain-containing protein [Mesorhizobium sp. BR1-1-16]|uniref:substrate-binding domain-containing protein n=1 Tax=Mesorhizobium sp. BR1-1-16 TaxID=2876653 RepID=UPI001CCBF0FF|nr:substrate-binding domain-containing protein [Mesorhizobium sp. BR1-1-16]MBZ9937201.1 substrate-binding domain-containing protein [Mesorhizobium sp. BR1-1-16]